MDAGYQTAAVRQGLLVRSAFRLLKEDRLEVMLAGQRVPAMLS